MKKETKYLKLSLKWAHKQDKWFTFWRGNYSGYCWFKDWCRLYDKEEDDWSVKHIDSDLIKDDWVEIEYEGKKQLVLPNTPETRVKIGITTKDLVSTRKN